MTTKFCKKCEKERQGSDFLTPLGKVCITCQKELKLSLYKERQQKVFTWCFSCKQTKQEHEMIRGAKKCKECHKQKVKGWRKSQTGIAYYKVMDSKRKQYRFREKVLDKWGKCVRCGETERGTLEFDHIDPRTKKFEISKAVKGKFPVKAIKEEMRKCQILCFNCHVKKTKQDRIDFADHYN